MRDIQLVLNVVQNIIVENCIHIEGVKFSCGQSYLYSKIVLTGKLPLVRY